MRISSRDKATISNRVKIYKDNNDGVVKRIVFEILRLDINILYTKDINLNYTTVFTLLQRRCKGVK